MRSIHRVQVVENAQEIVGAVELAAGNSGIFPVELTRPGITQSHGPPAEQREEISEWLQTNLIELF